VTAYDRYAVDAFAVHALDYCQASLEMSPSLLR